MIPLNIPGCPEGFHVKEDYRRLRYRKGIVNSIDGSRWEEGLDTKPDDVADEDWLPPAWEVGNEDEPDAAIWHVGPHEYKVGWYDWSSQSDGGLHGGKTFSSLKEAVTWLEGSLIYVFQPAYREQFVELRLDLVELAKLAEFIQDRRYRLAPEAWHEGHCFDLVKDPVPGDEVVELCRKDGNVTLIQEGVHEYNREFNARCEGETFVVEEPNDDVFEWRAAQ